MESPVASGSERTVDATSVGVGSSGDVARTVVAGSPPSLAALSERQRAAVVLVHGCGWSYSEVARAIGVTKSSVGTHVARAMQQLRTSLGADHDA